MQRNDVGRLEERLLARCRTVAVAAGADERRVARQDLDVQAECSPITRDHRADPAVPVDAQRLAAYRVADAGLPFTGSQRVHLLRNPTHRGKNERERQFGGRIRGRVRVLARRHDDAKSRARRDVDVRVDAPLADEPECGQPFEQRRLDLRPLADEDQCLGVPQPLRQHADILDMIVPDRDIMACEHAEARQRSKGVVVVVEDRNFHRGSLARVNVSISWHSPPADPSPLDGLRRDADANRHGRDNVKRTARDARGGRNIHHLPRIHCVTGE